MTPVSYIQLFDLENDSAAGDFGLDGAPKSVGEIAECFVRARLSGAALPAYPGSLPADLATAYACQEAAIQRWPDVVAGWKVARIGPAWQSRYPEERLVGPVFRNNVHTATPDRWVACPAFAGGLAAVEAEIGICVGADAPAGKTDWTGNAAIELVADMHIGVEMAGSPLATLNDLGPGAVIADFGNNWGVIIGAPIPGWRTRSFELAAQTHIDEECVGRGSIAIPREPLNAFAFALNKAAQLGRPLRAGAYISTGMITGVHDIRIGAQARVSFDLHGDILCRVVKAAAYGASSP